MTATDVVTKQTMSSAFEKKVNQTIQADYEAIFFSKQYIEGDSLCSVYFAMVTKV